MEGLRVMALAVVAVLQVAGIYHIDGATGGGGTNENNHGGGSFYTPMHYSQTGTPNPPDSRNWLRRRWRGFSRNF